MLITLEVKAKKMIIHLQSSLFPSVQLYHKKNTKKLQLFILQNALDNKTVILGKEHCDLTQENVHLSNAKWTDGKV